jgi:transcriptional regulator with GAF, ATPase, and Fis domain
MLGRSVAMRRVFAVLERISPTDTTVLIDGETGTGKELVAEAIHEESQRSGGPFVVFDCSAVSATLIESELFGHVRGSFTGAVGDRPGAFEAADGGTLFLDEIGELPLDLQPKLLRALERREVRRVGSNVARRVDVRIVAATNRNLAREVERGKFREDLYYRLAVIPVSLPPLRERLDDISLLVRHFEEQLRARSGSPSPLPDEIVAGLAARSWPGNVRELRNAVARALSLGSAGAAGGPAAPQAAVGEGPVDLNEPLLAGRERVADVYERTYIEAALKQTGGNVSRAAELAQVNRKFIQRAMKRFGLRGDIDPAS